jgi:hypothetical protein
VDREREEAVVTIKPSAEDAAYDDLREQFDALEAVVRDLKAELVITRAQLNAVLEARANRKDSEALSWLLNERKLDAACITAWEFAVEPLVGTRIALTRVFDPNRVQVWPGDPDDVAVLLKEHGFSFQRMSLLDHNGHETKET